MKRLRFFLLGCILFPMLLPAQGGKGVQRFLPHHVKLQFAGGIGFLSAGFGYETKNKKMQADLYYGYVPESAGGIEIHSVTGKFTWLPLSREYKNTVRVDLLTAGVLINYAFGRQYFLFSPENYPLKYYGLPTAAHIGFFAGGGIRYKKTALYYELGTTDKILGSYVRNVRSLAFTDIFNIAIGARVAFRK
jgi:hypothetical protein